MTTTLLRNARIATLDPAVGDLDRADILVQDGSIAQVGPDLEEPRPGVEVVDLTGMLVIPGMADTHIHTWEHLFRGRASTAWGMEYFINLHPLGSEMTPEDIYAGVFAGAVESLAHGVTAILDYNHTILTPDHADASIEALGASGIRGTLCYDLAGRDVTKRSTFGPSKARFGEIERVHGRLGSDGLVRVGVGLSGIAHDRRETVEAEVRFARELGLPMTFHNNRSGELRLLDEWGLLGPDILPAHGNWITDDDLDVLAAVGGYLSVTPEVESFGGRRALSMTGRAHSKGVNVCLGVDVPAMTTAGLLTQMRYIFLLQRVFEGISERVEGHVPVARRPGVPGLPIEAVLEFGTAHGYGALGLGEVGGRIAPGMAADLVAIDARVFGMAEGPPAVQVLFHSHYGDVRHVMVGGTFVKRDGDLVGLDLATLADESRTARARVLAAAGDLGAGPMRQAHWDWVPAGER